MIFWGILPGKAYGSFSPIILYMEGPIFSWGADFIFSGHNHGGVIRFSENRGLISPQFHLLPSFCCGHFQRGKKHMIVSAGLGEHTVPVRIHNPRELVFVELTSADNE